jgi:hypothetical protein
MPNKLRQIEAKTGSTENSNTAGASLGKIIELLNGFYDIVGNKPEVEGSIAKMAAFILSEGADARGLRKALARCAKECGGFPIRLPQIMERIPGMEIPQEEAKARAAWDILMAYVQKYIGVDPEGRYGPEYGSYGAMFNRPARFPTLDQRTLDTVRRTGGWIEYARINYDGSAITGDGNVVERKGNFPFVQKRFMEEWLAWAAVDNATPNLGQLLNLPPKNIALLAKPMEPREVLQGESREEFERDRFGQAGPAHTHGPVDPPTPGQLRDRATVQKITLARRILSNEASTQKEREWAQQILKPSEKTA